MLFAIASTLVTCNEKNKTRGETPVATTASSGGGSLSQDEATSCASAGGGCTCDVCTYE